MSSDRLSLEEQTEARRQAEMIQRIVNTAVGRRLVRCMAPLRFIRTRDVAAAPSQGARFGVELRVEPLVTIADYKEEPAKRMAAVLREWAALLNQGAAALEN